MTSRWAWALGALLVASAAVSAAADDNARKKGSGGSSGGGGESAGARHTGGGSSRSGGEVRSGGGDRDSGRTSSVESQRERGSRNDDPPARRVSGAEARHPEPGTGNGRAGRSGRSGYGYSGSAYYPRYSNRSYYRPYWGWYGVPYYDFYWDDPFYYGGGYGSGYGSGYGGGYGPSYARDRYRYRETGSVRTLIDPEKTKVFVDGYYAGEADDFDGMFQRLYVAPGRHDITLKLEGHRTHRVMVYVTEDHTIKIRHNMERGAGEETVEDLSGGREEPPYRVSDDSRAGRPYDDRRDDRIGRAPVDERRDARDARETSGLRLDVRPDDASIYVDGQFYGSARRAGIINLPPGRHRIEVVRPGHRTVEREVEIQAGRTETLAIDLERQ